MIRTPIEQPVIPAPLVAPVSGNGHVPPRSRGRRRWLVWAGVVVLIVILLALPGLFNHPTPPSAPATSAQTLTAHGVIQPVARASIATMNGGVVEELDVEVGQPVQPVQVLARVRLSGQTELLVAPWAGTVTGVNAHLGDTLLPGTTVATIGDLSRYRVETTDVDEYLIGYIKPGQPVSMTVEALSQAQLAGFVKTVGLAQQQSSNGSNYPVVIDLAGSNPELRPGMTVRITFENPPAN